MADTLPDALKSLFQICELQIEIIVINDGSTDAVKKIINQWDSDSSEVLNITFQSVDQENSGRAGALNEGAKQAKGKFLTFLDADDVIDPNELITLWQCAESGRYDFVIGQFKIVNDAGKLVSNRSLPMDISKKKLIRKLAYSPLSPLTLNAFLIKKEYFFELGGLDPDNLKSEDKDLIIRLLQSDGQYKICDSFHYVYKKHNLPRRRVVSKRLQWMKYRQQMIEKNFSGNRKLVSKILQFNYDLLKLAYELFITYRAR